MQKNLPCELPGCFSTVLLFLLIPKSGDSLKEQREKKKEKSIPGTLEFEAKYIKKRRGHGCNLSKKRNINIY